MAEPFLPPGFVNSVRRFEGFTPQAAWDYQQHSNGFGTRAKFPGETIDKDEADRRLQAELGHAAGLVSAFAPNAPEGVKHLTFKSMEYWAG